MPKRLSTVVIDKIYVITKFSPSSAYSSSHRSRNSPQLLVLRHPESVFFSYEIRFQTHYKIGKTVVLYVLIFRLS
jgi:hypothetical protein